MINIAPDTTAIDPDRAGHGINRCAAQATEVDDESVVPDRETTTMVTTATDGERQDVVAGVRHADHHVGHVGAPYDRERASIYCAVVDGSCRFILRIRRSNDCATKSLKIIEA
jgi:hypothetical protein